MGNSFQKLVSHSTLKRKTLQEEARCAEEEEELPKIIPDDILTDDEIKCIQLSWPYLSSSINKILTQAFLDLFVQNPDIKDKFMNFRNFSIEDLKRYKTGSDNALQRHIPRVSRAIVKVVNNVENLDKVIDYLECVGKIHHKNGIMHHEMISLGPFFVSAATKHLPSKYRKRKDVLEAWNRLFVVINDLLRRGYPNVELDLSTDEKTVITQSFGLIRDRLADVGVSTFVGLFKEYSTSKMFFPNFKDSPIEDLKLNETLQNHGLRVMKVIETVVNQLDTQDPNEIDIYLAKLGSMHQKMGVEKKYLDMMGPIFCHSVRDILINEGVWNITLRHAWLHLFRIVALKIKRGYSDSAESI